MCRIGWEGCGLEWSRVKREMDRRDEARELSYSID